MKLSYVYILYEKKIPIEIFGACEKEHIVAAIELQQRIRYEIISSLKKKNWPRTLETEIIEVLIVNPTKGT